MNKVFIGLILAVCVLGMALVMLNERLGRKSDSPATTATQTVKENRQPADTSVVQVFPNSGNDTKLADATLARETTEARESLAPPVKVETSTSPVDIAPQVPQLPNEAGPTVGPAEQNPIPVVAPKPETKKPEIKAEAKKPEPKAEDKKPEQKAETKAAKPAEPKAEAKKPEVKQEKADSKSAQQKQDKEIKIVVFAREKGATVRISGNAAIHYNKMTLTDPDRIVIDLDGHWEVPANTGIPRNDLVNNMRFGKNGDKTRIVIVLNEKPRLDRVLPNKSGDSIDIRVDK